MTIAPSPHRKDSQHGKTETCAVCGAKNPAHAKPGRGLDSMCGGTGYLTCNCGGDGCFCHHHGETICMGCDECEGDADDDCDGEGANG